MGPLSTERGCRVLPSGVGRFGAWAPARIGGVLVTRPVLERIRTGEIDLVFRRWRRPSVRTGGRLRTVIGELAIVEVAVVDPRAISDEQARRAGFADADAVRTELFRVRPAGERARVARPDADSLVYRVHVAYRGEDPRAALRERLADPAELDGLVERIAGVDRRAARPWAAQALELIDTWPARRAPELAELAGWETAPWKAHVRRLKELGLTESLPVGYRLSPRGEQVLAELRRSGSYPA